MTNRKIRLARCCGLCSSAYLVSPLFNVPDSVRYLTAGVVFGLLILALLPEEVLEKLEKLKPWMRHGE